MAEVKRALLTGIDHYARFSGLRGCVNDARALHPLVARNDDASPNFDCQLRTSASDSPVERDDLLNDLDRLFAPGAAVALFYFAGHGAPQNGDVVLCTSDGTETSPGIAFSDVLTRIQRSSVAEIVIILDCCFAGSAGGVPQLAPSGATLREGVSILAAARGDQTAAETLDGRGMFSTSLEGALDGGAAEILGRVTVAGVYSYLDESFGSWDQRPTFKANLERLNELRICDPAVELGHLRRISELFPTARSEFRLDPSFEFTEEPRHEDNEAAFAALQKLQGARLVEPVGHEHMYFAAMNNASCRLTPLGRHYWDLASKGRL